MRTYIWGEYVHPALSQCSVSTTRSLIYILGSQPVLCLICSLSQEMSTHDIKTTDVSLSGVKGPWQAPSVDPMWTSKCDGPARLVVVQEVQVCFTSIFHSRKPRGKHEAPTRTSVDSRYFITNSKQIDTTESLCEVIYITVTAKCNNS